jgi:uncharacterized protein
VKLGTIPNNDNNNTIPCSAANCVTHLRTSIYAHRARADESPHQTSLVAELNALLWGGAEPLYLSARVSGHEGTRARASTSPLWDHKARLYAPSRPEALDRSHVSVGSAPAPLRSGSRSLRSAGFHIPFTIAYAARRGRSDRDWTAPLFSPDPMPSIATFLRGGDQSLFELFERAGVNVHRAAELLDATITGYPDTAALAADIRACEHEGDQITHEVISRINQTFVTPIEREDILDLTSALDDIVDYIDEVAEYLGLYRIEAPMEQAQQLARILSGATRELSLALPLVRGFKDVTSRVVEVHRLENEGDRIVRGAIASLFETGIDPMFVIRWKDIFERLENAIDATERAAYVLEGIIIKNT